MPDFWGVVFPNYISAFGGLAATVLAIVSLVLAESARRRSRATARAEAETREVVAQSLELQREAIGAEADLSAQLAAPRSPSVLPDAATGDTDAITAQRDSDRRERRQRLDALTERLRAPARR
jgi:hypothetical protein